MSLLPQELMRKISAKTEESSKHISSSKVPDRRFRELMRVNEVDDRPKQKDFFKMLAEEADDEEIEEKMEALMALSSLPAPSFVSDLLLSKAEVLSRISAASLEALFEKMASTMIMMSASGDTETTLFLDNAHFASSIFFGSKITIREFSTAPKAFNIEIASAPAGVAALDAGKQNLLLAFQEGHFNFSIHRLDTHVLQHEERPVLHRKEQQDHGSQDQKGGQKQ